MEQKATVKVSVLTTKSEYTYNMSKEECSEALKSWKSDENFAIVTDQKTIMFNPRHVVAIELI